MNPLAVVLIPVAYFVLVRPIVWILFKVIPDGKVKTALFRQRGR